MAQGKAYTKKQKKMILESLQDYLELGFSRSRACKMVGFDETTLCKWIKADEALSIKVQGWENAMNKLSLLNIRDSMLKEAEGEDSKKENSKWWAERKMKEDLSTRTENTGPNGKDLPTPIIKITRDVSTNDSVQQDSETEKAD